MRLPSRMAARVGSRPTLPMTAVTTVSLSASSAAAKRPSMPLMTWMGRSFSRSRSHMRTCCASASVQLSRM